MQVSLYQKMREYQNLPINSCSPLLVSLYQKLREYQNGCVALRVAFFVSLYQKMREYQNPPEGLHERFEVSLYQKMRELKIKCIFISPPPMFPYTKRCESTKISTFVTFSHISFLIPKDARVPKLPKLKSC